MTSLRIPGGAWCAGLHLMLVVWSAACSSCSEHTCPLFVLTDDGQCTNGAISPDPRGNTGAWHGWVSLQVLSQAQVVRDDRRTTYRLEGVSRDAAPVQSRGETISTEMRVTNGWTIADLVGQSLTLDRWGGLTDCLAIDGPGASLEHMAYGYSSMRDGAGELLFAESVMPLTSGGTALSDPLAIPELAIGWADVGCSENGSSYAVALTVRTLVGDDDSETHQAKPGERVRLTLGGKPFTFLVEHASGPSRDDLRCGAGGWTLYRDDFLTRELH